MSLEEPRSEKDPRGAVGERAEEEAAEVARELATIGVHVGAEQIQAFSVYLTRVRQRGQRINLVSGGDLGRLGRRHLLESFNILSCPLQITSGPLADAGSGAGFPGLPLASLVPELRVLLIESVRKKARFLTEIVDELGLGDRVRVAAERVEVLAARPEHAGAFNTVTVRGLGPLSRVAPWCAPLLRPRGYLVAFKGTDVERELSVSIKAIAAEGLELMDIVPLRWGDGNLVILRRSG